MPESSGFTSWRVARASLELLSNLAEWVLAWAESPYAGLALFALAFAESSFFPLPPDPLQIVLSAGNIQFAFWFAAITTGGSLLGAVLGYYIGLKGGRPLLDRMFDQQKILFVESQYRRRDVWAVAIAGFTPIPYKLFAVGAGVFRLDLRRFLLASLVGRAGRFFLVAAIMTIFGEAVQVAIDRYLNILAVAFVVMLIGGVVVVRLVTRQRHPVSKAAGD